MATTLGEVAVEGFPCPTCTARVRQSCMVRRGPRAGAPVGYIHAARLRPLEEAWRIGFREGRLAHAYTVRRRLEEEHLGTPGQIERVTRLDP